MTHLWEVETQAAVYEVDMDSGWLSRFIKEEPLNGFPATQLRKDGERIPLLSIEKCDVGGPLCCYLQIRDDGVMTYRETTPVVQFHRVNSPSERLTARA